MNLKRSATLFIIILALVVSAALVWMFSPVKLDKSAVNTSLALANANNKDAIPFHASWFEYRGQNLHYVEAGDGPEVIVFIHGFPSYWYAFIRQMQFFKKDFRVIAIDGLGVGQSDAPHEISPYKLESMAAHLNALLSHVNAQHVHLVGHDWGSAFALGYTQRYPNQVRSVTGISAPSQNIILKLISNNSHEQEVFSYVETFKKANPILLAALRIENRIWQRAYEPLVSMGALSTEEGQLFRQTLNNPKRINAHINWYRANIPTADKVQAKDFWPSPVAKVDVPTLFIWGTKDRIITPAVIEEIKLMSKNLVLSPLENIGHWPLIERASEVTELIKKHVTQSSSRTSK